MNSSDFGLDYYLQFGHNNDNIGTVIRNLALIAKAEKTLIAPCGYGQMVRYLNDFGHACEGIDVNPHLIARRIDQNIILGRIEEPPLPSGRYDLIICCDLLEHLDESAIRIALNEIERMSSSDSFLVLRVGTNALDMFDEDPTHRTKKDDRWWIRQVMKETRFLPHTYSAAVGEYVFSKNDYAANRTHLQKACIHSVKDVATVGEPAKKIAHLANRQTGETIHFHYRDDHRMACERFIPRLGLKRYLVSLIPEALDTLVDVSLYNDGTLKVEGNETIMADMIGLGPLNEDEMDVAK